MAFGINAEKGRGTYLQPAVPALGCGVLVFAIPLSDVGSKVLNFRYTKVHTTKVLHKAHIAQHLGTLNLLTL